MRILFVTPFLPYPPDGDGTRLIIWNLAVELSKRHELYLLALSNGKEPPAALEAVRGCFTKVIRVPTKEGGLHKVGAFLRSLISGRPYGIEKFFVPCFVKELDSLADATHFDAIHVDSYLMAQYRGRRENVTWLLSAHDSRSLTLRDRLAGSRNSDNALMTWLMSREIRLMQHYEATQYAQFGSCIVVAEKDRAHLQALNPCLRLHVVPNGVRMERDTWQPPADPHGIAFVGDIGYFPNEDAVLTFARQSFPTIRQHVPDASFFVVGRNPSPEVRALQDTYRGVQVTGEVADVREYIRRCSVSVAPLRYGSGVKNKILDAWAEGRPVVAFDEACTGLREGFDQIIIRSSTPATMAEDVVRILRNTETARHIGVRAMAFVRKHHSWEETARHYEDIYAGRKQ